MPVSGYFKGHGDHVMASMKRQFKDPKKAKEVFYATAAKREKSAQPKKK